jgi:hypothetical protein
MPTASACCPHLPPAAWPVQVQERRLTSVRPLSSDTFQSGNTTSSHMPHVLGPWKTCAGVFTLTTFEEPNPGGMYVTSFKQDSVTGGGTGWRQQQRH